MEDLNVDPTRIGEVWELTGVYIRAKGPDGRWGSFDIVQLDRESLRAFLEEKPKKWSVDLVGILCGHGHLYIEDNIKEKMEKVKAEVAEKNG